MWVDGEGSGKDGGDVYKARVEGLELDGIVCQTRVLLKSLWSDSFESSVTIYMTNVVILAYVIVWIHF